MPTLDRITIYPLKSLEGLDVGESRVLESGALEHDRRWRLVDMDGRVVNAKRSPLIHAIRAEFELSERLVTLWIDPAALAAKVLPAGDRDRLQGLAGHPTGHPAGQLDGGIDGRQRGFLTRDSRVVERKKYGRAGARARFQFSKR